MLIVGSWYILQDGLDTEGCGKRLENACGSLDHLVNELEMGARSLCLPQSVRGNIEIITDMDLTIGQEYMASAKNVFLSI